MTAPIADKQTLTRLAWITELRRQGHRKCEEFFSNICGDVCALGLLGEVAGLDGVDLSITSTAAAAGLSFEQAEDIAARNDGGDRPEPGYGNYHQHSFAEIADVVASWFK